MIVSKKLAILLIIEVFVALLPALFYFVLGMFLLPDLVNKIISDYDYGALLFVIMFLAGLFGLIGFYYLALFVLLEPNMGKKESSPGLVTQCYMS